MANLQAYEYPGFGKWSKEIMGITQAIRVGNRIVCSAQGMSHSLLYQNKTLLNEHILGGWDPKRTEFSLEDIVQGTLEEEIDQAFKNCDLNLKHAGGKGWSQVYRVVTYCTDPAAQQGLIMQNFKKWMPDHCPTWQLVGVTALGSPTMHVEIEVEAYDPTGAAEAKNGGQSWL